MKKLFLAGLLALPALGFSAQNAEAFFSFKGYRVGTYDVTCPRFHFNIGFDSGKACPPPLPCASHPGGGYCPAGPGGANPWDAYGPWYMHFPKGGQQGFVPGHPQNFGYQGQPAPQGPQSVPVNQPTPPAAPAKVDGPQPTSYNPYANYNYNYGYHQYYYNSGYNAPAYWYGR